MKYFLLLTLAAFSSFVSAADLSKDIALSRNNYFSVDGVRVEPCVYMAGAPVARIRENTPLKRIIKKDSIIMDDGRFRIKDGGVTVDFFHSIAASGENSVSCVYKFSGGTLEKATPFICISFMKKYASSVEAAEGRVIVKTDRKTLLFTGDFTAKKGEWDTDNTGRHSCVKLFPKSKPAQAGEWALAFTLDISEDAAQKKYESGRTKWKLAWSDEFNTDGVPDPAKWKYEKGPIRNHELQHYTDDPENVCVKDGCLVITALKKKIKNIKYDPAKKNEYYTREFFDYTSASVITESIFGYGRLEARIKMPPAGQSGPWPAFWTLGKASPAGWWPETGEIDIIEYVPKDRSSLFATVHWRDKNKKHQSYGSPMRISPSNDFHVYAMERDEKSIRIYYDDTLYFTYDVSAADNTLHGNTENPFKDLKHKVILNLALGGWGGDPGKDIFPCRMYVDYVRYYEKEK